MIIHMILIKQYLNTTYLQMKFGDVTYNFSSRCVLKKKINFKQVSLLSTLPTNQCWFIVK